MNYTNTITSSFENMIPNYDHPQSTEVHHERKDLPSHQQPAVSLEGQHFTSNGLLPRGFGHSQLYSDLDAIDLNDQLMDKNMDLYDTGHLDAEMMTSHQHEEDLFQSQSTMDQDAEFNTFVEENVKSPNTVQDLQSLSNPMLSHPNKTLSSTSSESAGHSSLIQQNQDSASRMVHLPGDSTLIEPISTSSFYQNTYNPAQTTFAENSPSKSEAANSETTNGVVTSEMQAPVDAVSLDVDSEVSNEDGHDGEGPQEDPLATNENGDQANNENGEAGNENGNEEGGTENGEGEVVELEKCVRDGCENTAVVNPEWEDEYCSNECCIKHCTTVFNAWVEENLRNSNAQNDGVQP